MRTGAGSLSVWIAPGILQCGYSAKAGGDVVIYALLASDFEPLLAKYPHVARYVEAHATAGAMYREPARKGVHERFVAELLRNPEPLSCRPESTIAEAAGILQDAKAEV